MEQQTSENPLGIPILPEAQSLYFNGFAIAVGMGDIVVTLLRNGVPSVTLNASFTVAKSLGVNLSKAVQVLEENANHNIMTVEEVQSSIQKYHGKN